MGLKFMAVRFWDASQAASGAFSFGEVCYAVSMYYCLDCKTFFTDEELLPGGEYHYTSDDGIEHGICGNCA
jgi:hypothetical protein